MLKQKRHWVALCHHETKLHLFLWRVRGASESISSAAVLREKHVDHGLLSANDTTPYCVDVGSIGGDCNLYIVRPKELAAGLIGVVKKLSTGGQMSAHCVRQLFSGHVC